jgi:hypothetical protein
VKSFLAENLDLMFEITEKVRQAVGIGNEDAEGEGTDSDVIVLDAEE